MCIGYSYRMRKLSFIEVRNIILNYAIRILIALIILAHEKTGFSLEVFSSSTLAPLSDLESVELSSEVLMAFENNAKNSNQVFDLPSGRKSLVVKKEDGGELFYVFLFEPGRDGIHRFIAFEMNSRTEEPVEKARWACSGDPDQSLNAARVYGSMPEQIQPLFPGMIRTLYLNDDRFIRRFVQTLMKQKDDKMNHDSLASQAEDEQIQNKGNIHIADRKISWEELQKLSQISGLRCDLTGIPQNFKDQIMTWKGSLIDNGKRVSYPRLREIQGDFEVRKALSFEADQLELAGGNVDLRKARNFRLSSLKSVIGSLDTRSATLFNARSLISVGLDLIAGNSLLFKSDSLRFVGRNMDVRKVTKLQVQFLEEIRGSLIAFSADLIDAASLWFLGGDLYAGGAMEFKAPNLKHSGNNLFLQSVTNFKAEVLEYVGGAILAGKALYFSTPLLRQVEEHIMAANAKEFEADSLETVGGTLDARKAVVFKASKLRTVKGGMNVPRVDLVKTIPFDLTSASALAPKANLQSVEKKMLVLKVFKEATQPFSQTENPSPIKSLVLKNSSSVYLYYVFFLSDEGQVSVYEVNSRTLEISEKAEWAYSGPVLNEENILRSMPLAFQREMPGMVKALHYGELFLKSKFNDLHTSPEVLSAKEKTERETGRKISRKPETVIRNYLQQFKEDISNKEKMYALYVIKPEDVPESYFRLQQKIAREQGRGNIEMTEEEKKERVEALIADQISTLDIWLDFFSSSDSDPFPLWARYWAFRSMVKLSLYDKENRIFARRDKNTVTPFQDLNREALAYVIDLIVQKAEGRYIPEGENRKFEKMLERENFGELYAYAMEQAESVRKFDLKVTSGRWVQYHRSEDYMKLVSSLKGFGTGWCLIGSETSKSWLSEEDFHVYYSEDRNGNPVVPRLAIRMGKNRITEVRGIGYEQNIDPYMSEITEKKLQELDDGTPYLKRAKDMKRLTVIDNKMNSGVEFSREDLIFLYEIEDSIEGLGYQRDPRIEEIRNKRKDFLKQDYARIYQVSEKEVIDQLSDLTADTKVYLGSETYVPPNTLTKEEFLNLGNIHGLNVDLTGIPQAFKDELVIWKGALEDKGENAFYPKLKHVEKSFIARNAVNLKINSLKYVGKSLLVSNAMELRADSLVTVGGSLTAQSAQELCLASLQTAGAIYASSASEFIADQLHTVKEELFAGKAVRFKADSLKSVGGELKVQNAVEFNADSLKTVGKELFAPCVREFKAPSLRYAGWGIVADSARIFEADALEYAGNLNVGNAEEFKADKLKRVGLNLVLGKVKEFKAESLRTVVGNLEVQSAVRFKADALLNVGGKLAAESAVEFEADHLQNIGDEFHVPRSCLLKISSLKTVNGKKYMPDRGQIDSIEVDLTSISALAPKGNLQSVEKAMKALKRRFSP